MNPFELDQQLLEDIRKNFGARQITEKLMENCAAMAECIGVTVTWTIESVDSNKDVESSKLASLVTRLVTLGGAFCLGGKINPLKAITQRERDVKKA